MGLPRLPSGKESTCQAEDMQEAQGQSLGWRKKKKKKMATHFSILVWEIPWTVKPGGLQSMGSLKS